MPCGVLQEEIHQLLCEYAEAGNTVLRLKGGDPFVFGRGGEEALHLQDRGIAVHSVPGGCTQGPTSGYPWSDLPITQGLVINSPRV